MVTIESHRGPLNYRLVFWPDQEELTALADGVGFTSLVKVVQTPGEASGHPHLIREMPFRTQVIGLQRDPEEIYGDMDRTCRYHIRKVRRELDRVRVARNEEQVIDDFFVLYNDFVKASGHNLRLKRKRYKEYAAVSDVWVLYWDGRAMCGRLDLRDEQMKRARLIFSTSRRLESEEDAKVTAQLNRYLMLEELLAYRHEGFDLYDLGGIGDGTNSVARFKLSFGGSRNAENRYLLGGGLGRLADSSEKLVTSLWRRTHGHAPSREPEDAT
jgi:lipid II:glycine glycyltransferase (peptidoglycan interpeptide bridge formation enzyme)